MERSVTRRAFYSIWFWAILSPTDAIFTIAAPKASPKALRRVQQPHPQLGHRVVRPIQENGMPESSSGESLAAHLASVSRKANGVWTRPLLQTAKVDDSGLSSENEGSVWDDDFAEIPDVTKLAKGITGFYPSQSEAVVPNLIFHIDSSRTSETSTR